MYYDNNKSLMYYGTSQEHGNECIIYHQVYCIWTLSGHYIIMHIKSYLINWADDTPDIEEFIYSSEDAMETKLNELKKEYSLIEVK